MSNSPIHARADVPTPGLGDAAALARPRSRRACPGEQLPQQLGQWLMKGDR
jgi:hypothetical protein